LITGPVSFLEPVESAVLAEGHQLQVARCVVGAVSVLVMHDLVASEAATEDLLHDHAVLHPALVRTAGESP